MSWILATTPKERPYTTAAKTTPETIQALWRKHGWVDPAKDKQAQARFKLNQTRENNGQV